MNQEISLEISQKLALTPELRQSIQILQMSAADLAATIEKEFLENPLLEIEYAEEPIKTFEDKNLEPKDVSTPSLQDFLIEQAKFTFGAEKLTAARFLIESIDNRGYLTAEISELAQILQVEEEFLEEILSEIQKFEPAGVGARNLSECLRLQAARRGIFSGILAAIIEKHLEKVAEHRIKEISRAEKVSVEEIRAAIEIICGLNPKPGASYGFEAVKFIIPDVRVDKGGEIVLNSQVPRLSLSEIYSDAKILDEDAKIYVLSRLSAAKQLIIAIRRREQTLLRVVEEIIRRQGEFLEKGMEFLKPMTMREVAEALELHESTISRAVANKFIEFPFGVVEMRKIFSAKALSAEEITSARVKSLIMELIAAEDKKNPLSDKKLAEILNERGILVARRTVMKYREQLGQLSSTKRKK